MRDITRGITFYHDFTTRAFATGIPGTLSGTPVLSVLEENNATPITAGVSVTVDRASVTGLNEAKIVATGANGYGSGKSYSIYISTGTVGGVSVIGEVVGQFTVDQSAAAVDVANATDGLGALRTLLLDIPTVSEFDARTLVAASYFNPAVDTVATVTTLTNLPAITANWLTAAGINAGALNGKGDWALASVLGALNDAAVGGDPTATDTIMQYIKQLVNVLVGTAGVVTFPAAAAPGNAVSLAEIIRSIYDDSNELQTDDIPGTLGSPAGASMSADLLTIDNFVDGLESTIGAAGAGLSAIPWNAAWDAEVESEVNDALDTAISELGVAIPTATPTIRTALMLLYMALRDKTVVQTSGTDALEIYNNAGTLIAKKLLTDDGSDYTEAKMSSG